MGNQQDKRYLAKIAKYGPDIYKQMSRKSAEIRRRPSVDDLISAGVEPEIAAYAKTKTPRRSKSNGN